MTRKLKRHADGKPAADSQHTFLSAIRAGRATREQFDAWHSQHRSAGRGLVITLREVKPPAAHARKHGR